MTHSAAEDGSRRAVRAHVTVDAGKAVGEVDRRLFGGFVEHMGRGVYGGIYDPAHASADESGLRQDVVDLVRELGMTTFRYPGGNFVSGFRWEDGVGPVDDRPRRLNLAWHSTETNEFGLHEFQNWIDRVGGELMLAVNLGTRGVLEALDLVEYANVAGGTQLSDRRRALGAEAPLGVRMWCLGNEMDGPWQLGHRSAEDYGKLAAQVARGMRQLDPHLELVVCGSSHSGMPTFGEWERTVLRHTFDDVDFISCHAYYEEKDGDLASFLASATDMDRVIESVADTIDEIRESGGHDRTISISFDEWNVWYHSRIGQTLPTGDDWPTAPRLSEDDYTVADAVVVGDLLMSLLRHADRVRSASLAQVVNVIAPIQADPGGPAWRKSTFYPFAITARLARGTSVMVDVDSPRYESKEHGSIRLVEAAATFDESTGDWAIFLVNRSQDENIDVSLSLRGLIPTRVKEALTLSDRDPHAANTRENATRVTPTPNASATLVDATLSVVLPPVSWTAIALG